MQMDALISLAASYDPDFALYWALQSIAVPEGGLASSVPSGRLPQVLPAHGGGPLHPGVPGVAGSGVCSVLQQDHNS